MSRQALFDGLVVTPEGQPVTATQLGETAQYVVPDGDFRFHIDAEGVDRQVLRLLGEQISANKEAVTEGAMKMLGQDDLFTQAMISASLNHMDDNFDKLVAQGLPEGARAYLGMLGFRVTLNYHGEVLGVAQPGTAAPEDE
jgi:hypothetical protein